MLNVLTDNNERTFICEIEFNNNKYSLINVYAPNNEEDRVQYLKD